MFCLLVLKAALMVPIFPFAPNVMLDSVPPLPFSFGFRLGVGTES